jgi:hypothetical protein
MHNDQELDGDASAKPEWRDSEREVAAASSVSRFKRKNNFEIIDAKPCPSVPIPAAVPIAAVA